MTGVPRTINSDVSSRSAAWCPIRSAGGARPLYECYRQWAEGAGENAITETLFGRRLKDRGFSKEHRRYGTVYTGIALRAGPSASGEEV